MPYYNQFYLSERLKFDPFKNADYVDLHNQSAEGSKDSTNSNTSGFNTSTVNDVDNTHNDDTSSASSGTTHRNGTGGDTKDTTGASTDAEHSDTSASSTQNNTDTGSKSDTSTHTLAANVSTLTKEADTPLGSVSADMGRPCPGARVQNALVCARRRKRSHGQEKRRRPYAEPCRWQNRAD